MGVLDKFLSIMKLDDGDDEYGDDEFFDDDEYDDDYEESPREASFIKAQKTMIKILMRMTRRNIQHL